VFIFSPTSREFFILSMEKTQFTSTKVWDSSDLAFYPPYLVLKVKYHKFFWCIRCVKKFIIGFRIKIIKSGLTERRETRGQKVVLIFDKGVSSLYRRPSILSLVTYFYQNHLTFWPLTSNLLVSSTLSLHFKRENSLENRM